MQGSPTLYQLIDDNYRVKVPGVCTGSHGAAYVRERFATGRFLNLSGCWLQSPRKKAPAHHTELPRHVVQAVIPECLAESALVARDSAKTPLDSLPVLL